MAPYARTALRACVLPLAKVSILGLDHTFKLSRLELYQVIQGYS